MERNKLQFSSSFHLECLEIFHYKERPARRAKTSKTTGGAQTARWTSTPPAVFISRSPGGGGGVSVSRVSSYQHLKCSGNLIITMTSPGGGREGCHLTYRAISTCERNDCCLKYREEAEKHLIVVRGEEGRGGWVIIVVIIIKNSTPPTSSCYS